MSSKTLQNKFVTAALALIPAHGISAELLFAVEQKLGLKESYHIFLFPGGLKELVGCIENMLDLKMGNLAKKSAMPLKMRDKVQALIKLRLLSVPNSQNIFFQILKFYSSNVAIGAKHMWSTVDSIWYLCEDTATDFNYYTKRALLFAVYRSTLKQFVRDKSTGYTTTYALLSKNIDRVMKFGGVKKSIFDAMKGFRDKLRS